MGTTGMLTGCVLLLSLPQGGAIHDEFCGLSRLTGLQSLSFLVVGPLPAEVLAWGALGQLTQLEVGAGVWACVLSCCGLNACWDGAGWWGAGAVVQLKMGPRVWACVLQWLWVRHVLHG